MKKLGVLLIGCALLAGVIGCSGGGRNVKKVAVSGTVTLDGQPLEGVEIHFAGDGHNGMGITRADGSYDLITGAAVGKNVIYFKPVTSISAGAEEDTGIDSGQLDAMAAGGTAPPPQIQVQVTGPKLPEMYTDPTKANLTFEVPSGGASDANFMLTSK